MEPGRMEANGYAIQNGSDNRAGGASSINRPMTRNTKIPSVDEALPYSPIASFIPFNSGMVLSPSHWQESRTSPDCAINRYYTSSINRPSIINLHIFKWRRTRRRETRSRKPESRSTKSIQHLRQVTEIIKWSQRTSQARRDCSVVRCEILPLKIFSDPV